MPDSFPGFYSLLDQFQVAPLQALFVNQNEPCKQYIYTPISIGGYASLSLLFAHTVDHGNQILGHENLKQLQVTIIKITESEENKSIHRIDLSSSLPPPSASYGSTNVTKQTDRILIEDLISYKLKYLDNGKNEG